MKWIRGNLSFLIPGNKDPEGIASRKKRRKRELNSLTLFLALDMESLTTAQLKKHLTDLGLSTSDCVEKADLIQKLTRYQNTQNLRSTQYRRLLFFLFFSSFFSLFFFVFFLLRW